MSFESSFSNALGEPVSNLVGSRDVKKQNATISIVVSNKMVSDVDMLSSRVVNWVFGNCDGRLTVTVDSWWAVKVKAELLKQVGVVESFLCDFSESHVFSFSTRQSNGAL